jgi:hypothetical protein
MTLRLCGNENGAFMKIERDRVFRRIQSKLDEINQAVAIEFARHWGSDRIDVERYCFEFDESAIHTLVAVLVEHPILWTDLQNLVSVPVDLDALIYHALERTLLYDERQRIEDQLGVADGYVERRRIAKMVNEVDGRLGRCKEWGDDGGLSYCINSRIILPLMDWLLLRSMAFVLANDQLLWEDFRAVVRHQIQAWKKSVW